MCNWYDQLYMPRVHFTGAQAMRLHSVLRRVPHLILSSDIAVLKFLSFEQRAPYFHLALVLANDVASSDWVT